MSEQDAPEVLNMTESSPVSSAIGVSVTLSENDMGVISACGNASVSDSDSESEEDGEHEVEQILLKHGVDQYLIKGKGYEWGFVSWVDAEGLSCPDLLKPFNEKWERNCMAVADKVLTLPVDRNLLKNTLCDPNVRMEMGGEEARIFRKQAGSKRKTVSKRRRQKNSEVGITASCTEGSPVPGSSRGETRPVVCTQPSSIPGMGKRKSGREHGRVQVFSAPIQRKRLRGHSTAVNDELSQELNMDGQAQHVDGTEIQEEESEDYQTTEDVILRRKIHSSFRSYGENVNTSSLSRSCGSQASNSSGRIDDSNDVINRARDDLGINDEAGLNLTQDGNNETVGSVDESSVVILNNGNAIERLEPDAGKISESESTNSENIEKGNSSGGGCNTRMESFEGARIPVICNNTAAGVEGDIGSLSGIIPTNEGHMMGEEVSEAYCYPIEPIVTRNAYGVGDSTKDEEISVVGHFNPSYGVNRGPNIWEEYNSERELNVEVGRGERVEDHGNPTWHCTNNASFHSQENQMVHSFNPSSNLPNFFANVRSEIERVFPMLQGPHSLPPILYQPYITNNNFYNTSPSNFSFQSQSREQELTGVQNYYRRGFSQTR